jgi:threonine/homoserine efflux transporter RhtA
VADAAVLFAGTVFVTVLHTTALVSEVGVVLVIVGLMGLVPVVRLYLSGDPSGV